MTPDLFAHPAPAFAETREGALQRLREFVPRAGRYARDRNKVIPGHSNVSRLSAAIRHHLITEEECCDAALERYAPSTVEKFIQEVSWRRYWKAWLSLRPEVWASYLEDLATLSHDRKYDDIRDRAACCTAGESRIALMNHFARELVETGYLHNHARMWFAGWWIHVERLPWQLGADFFFRHLLDADPASNTLSWRWVAGLQTPGKTYLPRRGNIEKYVDPEILDSHRTGLEHLENPQAVRPENPARPPVTQPSLPEEPSPAPEGSGIWIHEEDLLPEHGPLDALNPRAILVSRATPGKDHHTSPVRNAWLLNALADARQRAGRHYGLNPELVTDRPHTELLPDWAERHGLRQVIAMRPEVGPLADEIPLVRMHLAEREIGLALVDRAEDLLVRPFATSGFFAFWKRCQQSGHRMTSSP